MCVPYDCHKIMSEFCQWALSASISLSSFHHPSMQGCKSVTYNLLFSILIFKIENFINIQRQRRTSNTQFIFEHNFFIYTLCMKIFFLNFQVKKWNAAKCTAGPFLNWWMHFTYTFLNCHKLLHSHLTSSLPIYKCEFMMIQVTCVDAIKVYSGFTFSSIRINDPRS